MQVTSGHKKSPRDCRGRYKKKAPHEVYLMGGVNPAAPYSPGPGGQVPSAKGGLTAVFGMGTGMTLSREPLKQTCRQ